LPSRSKGLAFTVQKALPLADGGSIIVTSSNDGVKGGPGRSIYAATKAAGRNLVRSWIQELKDRNIRVNAGSPASVETPGLAGLAGNQNPGDFFAAMAAHAVRTCAGRARPKQVKASPGWASERRPLPGRRE
jgi:NAD(P)-dependent dehydrogenase (short-subunit alcohol dehydrogenase family)